VIFHELAHQVVYVRGDTTFNESFAETVALEGTRRWLARSGTEEQRAAFEALERRRQAFAALVDKYRERLAEIYATALSNDKKRILKTEALHAMKQEYQNLKSASGGLARYDQWFGQPLNNAQLASASLYTQMVPAFQMLLARQGGDLPRFYHAVKDIGALPKEQRMTVLGGLSAAAPYPAH